MSPNEDMNWVNRFGCDHDLTVFLSAGSSVKLKSLHKTHGVLSFGLISVNSSKTSCLCVAVEGPYTTMRWDRSIVDLLCFWICLWACSFCVWEVYSWNLPSACHQYSTPSSICIHYSALFQAVSTKIMWFVSARFFGGSLYVFSMLLLFIELHLKKKLF